MNHKKSPEIQLLHIYVWMISTKPTKDAQTTGSWVHDLKNLVCSYRKTNQIVLRLLLYKYQTSLLPRRCILVSNAPLWVIMRLVRRPYRHDTRVQACRTFAGPLANTTLGIAHVQHVVLEPLFNPSFGRLRVHVALFEVSPGKVADLVSRATIIWIATTAYGGTYWRWHDGPKS